MRENSTREQQLLKFCIVQHISRRYNISDIFTKEDKDKSHYITIRNTIQSHYCKQVHFSTHNPILSLPVYTVLLVLVRSLSSVGGTA